MKHLINQIRSSAIVKKTGTVLLGTLISQVLIIGSIPFLSRIYNVSEFGSLGMFMLISMFGIQLFSWRFDYGIVSSKTLNKALNLIAVCIVASLISAIIFGTVLYIFSNRILVKADFEISKYIILIVVYAFNYSIWNSITFLNIKLAEFKINAILNVTRSVFTVILSFIFINFKSHNGLILGLVVGQIVGSLLLFLLTIGKQNYFSLLIQKFSPSKLKSTAFENSTLFKYSFPSATIEIVSSQLPQYIIGAFGTTVFGWFSQANRLLNAPLDLIGQSVRSVFWESASKQFLKLNNCIELFDKTLKWLAIVSIFPFIVLYLIAPWLFQFILGPDWVNAGYYARILIPLCFFRFLSNPLSCMFHIAYKQKYDFAIQLSVLLVVGIFFFGFSGFIQKPAHIIAFYSAVYSLKYIAELYFSRSFAKNHFF